MNPYVAVLLLMGVALAISGAMLVLSWVLGPKRPNPVKMQAYECGITPITGARVRFSIKFYLIAMLFILFDVEAIFLYPWAVVHRQLGLFGLVEMAIFMAILVVGYIYIWKRGAFEWD
jgi:NADH-quinone oxidoreductase subunit A